MGKDDIEKRSPRTSTAAVNLRIAGAPYDQIASTLGYASPSQARAAVEEQLAGMYEPEDRASLFKIVSARHEALIASLFKKATSTYVPDRDEFGDEIPGTLVANPDHLSYSKVLADVLSRYSVLHGLNAPAKVQVTPSSEEFTAVVGALVEKALESSAREADIFDDDVEDAVIVEDGEIEDL